MGSFSLYRSPSRLYLQSVDVKEDFLSLRRSSAALACAARLYRLTAAEAPAGCENDGLLRTLWSAMVQLRAERCPPPWNSATCGGCSPRWALRRRSNTAPDAAKGSRAAASSPTKGYCADAAPRGRRALRFRSASCSCCAPRRRCRMINSSNGRKTPRGRNFCGEYKKIVVIF